MAKRTGLGLSIVATLVLVVGAVVASAAGTFTDDDGNTHEGNIEAIAAAGITKGCNPPVNTLYCPGENVSRGAMAAFLGRALNLTDDDGRDWFSDDNGHLFENDINRLAAAGITKGCNPPTNDKYCPDGSVTRGAMAAFLVRAFGYSDGAGADLFDDDDGSTFENDIDKLATAGVTKGCNPPTNDKYCPGDDVKRDQMASFLARALGLKPITPSTTTTSTTTTTTQGPKTVNASMVNFGYNPDPITVNVGDTVKWTNNSGIDHTTTSSGNWNSFTVTTGDSFSKVFSSPGTFDYFCTIHGAVLMSGTVVVNP